MSRFDTIVRTGRIFTGALLHDGSDAAAHVASVLGKNYAIVRTIKRAIHAVEDRLVIAGLRSRCVAVRAVETRVLADPDATNAAVARAADAAIRDDGAEVICLGCAGMADIAERVSRKIGTRVVDGVTAAVPLSETLHFLGLRTSKVGLYAPSPERSISGWPLAFPEQLMAQAR